MALFTILALITKGVAIWISLLIVVVFAAAFLASGWEHRIYENRKRELEVLQRKLVEEPEGTLA